MEILKDGFRKLEDDRRKFEAEKRLFYAQKARQEEYSNPIMPGKSVAEALFRNVSNPLALRKRYRDLVKIFHPDNLFGDEELSQQINREYMRRRKEE